MDHQNQEREITQSLELIINICRSCNAEYRVIGSMLLVAYTRKIFRQIGDIDIVLDIKSKECVFKKLQAEGFTLIKSGWSLNRKWLNFTWIDAHKPGYLPITFLLVGEFNPSYFSYRFFNVCELRIKTSYLAPTPYEFNGIAFIGIPLASVMAGIKQSSFSPKRKLDKLLLMDEMKHHKVHTYNNLQLFVSGIKIPVIYDLFSFIMNVYGGIRVRFGKKYVRWER